MVSNTGLSFTQFAYKDPNSSIMHSSSRGSSSQASLSSTSRTAGSVINSDDEDNIPTPGKETSTSSSLYSNSSGWMQSRNPSTISHHEKSMNVLRAALDRSRNRNKIIPQKAPGITAMSSSKKSSKQSGTKRRIQDDSDDDYENIDDANDSDKDRFELPEHGRALLKLQEERKRLAETIRAARAGRRGDVKSSSKSHKQVIKKRTAIVDSDEEDEFDDDESESESDEEEEDDDDVDDDDEEEDDDRHRRKKRSEEVDEEDLVILDDSFDGENSWQDSGMTAIKAQARKVLQTCQAISTTLRQSLDKWKGNHNEAIAGKRSAGSEATEIAERDGQDCINLVSISTPVGKASRHGGDLGIDIITETEIHRMCPGLSLKGYQLVGVNWLKLLYQHKINGVLADDMGLGKTVQTIAFLSWLSSQHNHRHESLRQVHLIVVPASTVANWQNEFKKFCPSFNVVVYHGSQSEKLYLRDEIIHGIRKNRIDVVLTTYTMFERESAKDDRKFIYKLQFDYMVLDEAHCLKNPESSRYAKLSSVRAKHRLLLSGTPVQNDVGELMALLSFLMPKTFSKSDCELLLEAFGWQKGKSDKPTSGILSIQQLRKMLAPFVLRRVKQDVLDQLTDKVVVVEKVAMTAAQRQLYEDVTLRYLDQRKRLQLRFQAETESFARIEVVSKSKKQKTTVLLSDDDEPANSKSSSLPGKVVSTSSVVRKALAHRTTSETSAEKMLESVEKLSATEAKHLFTTLRKVANHPLLVRVNFRDQDVLERIGQIALAHDHFGSQCDLKRVMEEISGFSDFDLHQICLEYPHYLGDLQLSSDTLYDSPKMKLLKSLVPTLVSEGHRMLIFSQWTRLLDLLELLMGDLGLKYQRLDGSTPVRERQLMIDAFNASNGSDSIDDGALDADDEIKVFLLSTKAGGLGINLTSADTVILHDLDFNPENDKQAEDRCHRIGQTKTVTVYKLVTEDSVDEDIYDMGERKRKLSEAVLTDRGSNKGRGNGKQGAAQGGVDKDDDIGAIGRILQKAVQRVSSRTEMSDHPSGAVAEVKVASARITEVIRSSDDIVDLSSP